MEACRGSGNSPLLFGKNRLVPLPVFLEILLFPPFDVWGEGHPSDPLKDLSEVSPGTEPDGPDSLGAGQGLTDQVRVEMKDSSWVGFLGAFD